MFAHSLWTPIHHHTTIFGTVYISDIFHDKLACFTSPEYKDANGDFRLYFNGQSYAVK